MWGVFVGSDVIHLVVLGGVFSEPHLTPREGLCGSGDRVTLLPFTFSFEFQELSL